MCDLLCDVINAVFEAEIRVKSARLIKSHLKNQKKGENVELKTFLYKASSKRLFWNGIHNLLRRADARESADIIYHM